MIAPPSLDDMSGDDEDRWATTLKAKIEFLKSDADLPLVSRNAPPQGCRATPRKRDSALGNSRLHISHRSQPSTIKGLVNDYCWDEL